MNIVHMHSNSRGVNKVAVSQRGISQMTNTDMPGSKREKDSDWETGMSWAAASALQTGTVEAAQVPNHQASRTQNPNPFTRGRKAWLERSQGVVCMWMRVLSEVTTEMDV